MGGVRNYGLVTSIEELGRHCERLLAGDVIGIDIETGYHGPDAKGRSLHPETAFVVGVSFTCSGDWALYAPLGHDCGGNLDNVAVARLLWPVLNTGRCVAHNAGFELRHLAAWFRQYLADDPHYGAKVREQNGYFPILACTQALAYLAAEHQFFGLKYLTKAIFNHDQADLLSLFPGLAKNKKDFLRFNPLPLEEHVVNYACEDALWAWELYYYFAPKVEAERPMLGKVEHAIVQDVVPEMEDFGVAYDWTFMDRARAELEIFRDKFNAEIMADLSEMTGQPVAINLGSPKQVGDVLYNKLGYSTNVYTKGTRNLPKDQRVMATDKIALAGLAKRHPVVKRIVQWKQLTKLLGTYLGKYEGLFNYAADGRTHPHHLPTVVVTGRFAVADPPYQQSPKVYHLDLKPAAEAHARHKAAHGKDCTCADPEYAPPPHTCFNFNFRDAIVAPPGHYILGFDLSQAELRAIAGEAKEPELLRAFATGQDVHTVTTALMLGIPIAEVTKELRQIGKTLNFALLYGMGVKSLADRLGIEVDEAQRLYDSYFAVYANIAAWSQRQVAFGRQHGYVTSKFGRRLPIWEYKSEHRWIVQKGDRACVNYPIQGAATGDYMKILMVRMTNMIKNDPRTKGRVHLVMNVHDALEFYVEEDLNPGTVIEVLDKAFLPVNGWPEMQADWHFGRRWGSPVEIAVKDGRLIAKDGQREVDITATAYEEDDETGEEVEVMPEVDVNLLRQVALPKQPPAASTVDFEVHDEGRRVVIALNDAPTADGYRRFVSYLREHPGPNSLTVRTPDGELQLTETCRLDPSHTARVAVLLGPCTITFDAADVDADQLLQGLAI